MVDRRQIDWERIELQYRAGLMTLREMGVAHSVAESAIRKRAKRDGWARDLAAKVRAKADELVRKSEVRKIVRTEDRISEKREVAIGAELVANVKIAHRTDISRGRRLAMAMLEELEVETGDVGLFEELGEVLRSEDDKGQDKRNDIYMKVISGAGRIDSMKKLADTLKTLIGLERDAYGIAGVVEPVDQGDVQQYDTVETARRIAFLLAKAVDKGA